MTLSFDLTDSKESEEWEEKCKDKSFMQEITGIGILHNKHWHTLPAPKRFRKVLFRAELLTTIKKEEMLNVGERITCYVDDIQISLTVYFGNRPKMARIDVKRIGNRRFAPKER